LLFTKASERIDEVRPEVANSLFDGEEWSYSPNLIFYK
jgi:hypothetical protein